MSISSKELVGQLPDYDYLLASELNRAGRGKLGEKEAEVLYGKFPFALSYKDVEGLGDLVYRYVNGVLESSRCSRAHASKSVLWLAQVSLENYDIITAESAVDVLAIPYNSFANDLRIRKLDKQLGEAINSIYK